MKSCFSLAAVVLLVFLSGFGSIVMADCLNDQLACTNNCMASRTGDQNCVIRCGERAQECIKRQFDGSNDNLDNDPYRSRSYEPDVDSNDSAPSRRNSLQQNRNSAYEQKSSSSQSCTSMDSYIRGEQKFPAGAGHCAGEKVVYLTNNSSRKVACTVYLTEEERSAGRLSLVYIRPGQRVGGELGGLWTCDASNNSTSGFWCVLAEEEDCLSKIAR